MKSKIIKQMLILFEEFFNETNKNQTKLFLYEFHPKLNQFESVPSRTKSI